MLPQTPSPQLSPLPDRTRRVRALSQVRRVEGPRGIAYRTQVWLRYAAYFLVLVGCSAATQWMTVGLAGSGGAWLFVSAAILLVTAALGTMFLPHQRDEILHQTKHYLFGYQVLPATGIAALMWATHSYITGSAQAGDLISQNASWALPFAFFATIVIPVVVFVKLISGMRGVHRSRLDDQEMMALYSRQDGLQR